MPRCPQPDIRYVGMRFDEPTNVGSFVRLAETAAEDGEESPSYDARRALSIVQDLQAVIVRKGPVGLLLGKVQELSQVLGD